jgi:hypothetical protein
MRVVSTLALLAVLLVGSDAAFGQAKVTEKFDEEVSKHFTKSTKPSYAKRRAKKLGKPLIVLLTRNGCGACQNLKQSVNYGSEVKKLLDKFVVVHAENKHCAQWQLEGHGYAPQTLFFAPGEDDPLPIHGNSDNSPYFLHDDATLKWAMETTLEAVLTGARHAGTGEQKEL